MSTTSPNQDGASTSKASKFSPIPLLLTTVSGGVAGGIAGFVVNGLWGSSLGRESISGELPPWVQQGIYIGKQIRAGKMSAVKPGAVMGMTFAATYATIEMVREELFHPKPTEVFHPTATIAGCVSGASVTAKYGPKAACAGCTSLGALAAFSFMLVELADKRFG